MPGTLFVVATPIGNLEDITARALRVLREASIIAAEDTRRTSHLLARYAITTPTTSLHEHNETTKSAALVARLARGEHVALVSDAGTPTISDPGYQLIRAAIDAGIRVEPVPGPNAAWPRWRRPGFRPTRSCSWGSHQLGRKTEQIGSSACEASAGRLSFTRLPIDYGRP